MNINHTKSQELAIMGGSPKWKKPWRWLLRTVLLLTFVMLILTGGVVGYFLYHGLPRITLIEGNYQLAEGRYMFYPPALSPDGTQVWVYYQPASGKGAQYLFDIPTQSIPLRLENGSPVYWQPGGQVIAMSRSDQAWANIYQLTRRLLGTRMPQWLDHRPFLGLHLVDYRQHRVLSTLRFSCTQNMVFGFYPYRKGMVISAPDLTHIEFPRVSHDWIKQTVAILGNPASSIQCWDLQRIFFTIPGQKNQVLYDHGLQGFQLMLDETQLAQITENRSASSQFPAGRIVRGPLLLSARPAWVAKKELLLRVSLIGENDQTWDEIWSCQTTKPITTTPLVRMPPMSSWLSSNKGLLAAITEQVSDSSTQSTRTQIRIHNFDTRQTEAILTAEEIGEYPGGVAFLNDDQGILVIGARTGRIWEFLFRDRAVQPIFDPSQARRPETQTNTSTTAHEGVD